MKIQIRPLRITIWAIISMLLFVPMLLQAKSSANTPKIKYIRVNETSTVNQYKVVIIVKNDDNDEVRGVSATVVADDNGPAPTSKELKLRLDEKLTTKTEKAYSTNVKFEKSPIGYTYSITAEMLDSLGKTHKDWNTEKETILIEKECKTKYKIKTVNYTEGNVSGYYVFKFDFQLEDGSDVPDKIKMVVQLENCKGETQNILITLKFDSKTNTYTGSESILQDKTCKWELKKGEIGAWNACDELTAWRFDCKNSKSNGTGTRNATASTSQTQQSQLL